MKLKALPRLELYSFLYAMPIIDIAVNNILFKERLWNEWRIWVISFPLMFVLGFLSFYFRVSSSEKIEKKFPLLNQTRQRISNKLIICIVSMMASSTLIISLYSYFHIAGYRFQLPDYIKGAIFALCVNVVFETLYEGDYALSRYKEAAEEKEMLRQLSLQAEFDSLKNQVNPHFLFNCFNTLSSLIREDKARADVFLNELSRVYRYLLRNNEEGLSTLESEIRFIHSYYQLLQTRHGEAIRLNMRIDRKYDHQLLPSLSLQLLVENAVKHNILSKNKPLMIEIFTTDDDHLIVSNNLQRRTVKVPSNRVGLKNIRSKYDLLQQPGFRVMENDHKFIVMLPLISEELAEGRQYLIKKNNV